MTPILADVVSHRARFAWLAAGLAASVALAVALLPASAPTEPPNLPRSGCWMGRAPKRIHPHHGVVPTSCLVYQSRMLHLSECPQLPPASRQALLEAWTQLAPSWSNLPSDTMRELAERCRMATDALEETAAAISCDITGVNRHWPSYIASDPTPYNP